MKIVQASLDFFKDNESFQFQIELENGQDLDLIGEVRITSDDDIYMVEIVSHDLVDPETNKLVKIDIDSLEEIEDILNNNIDHHLEDSNRRGRTIDRAYDAMRDLDME